MIQQSLCALSSASATMASRGPEPVQTAASAIDVVAASRSLSHRYSRSALYRGDRSHDDDELFTLSVSLRDS